jgi:uncharacterized protein YecE (DUF72 family)
MVGAKVVEDITVAKFPSHGRYGQKAGQINRHFLDPVLFTEAFVKRLEPHHDKTGPLIFEFGTFAKTVFKTVDAFVEKLDPFLAVLPSGWKYAVEIRNKEYLGPAYFDCLARHGVAHVLNAWTRMPPLEEQAEMEGVYTTDFVVVRALLTHGLSYEQSVDMYEPYDRIQAPNPLARKALVKLIEQIKKKGAQGFMYINNRLEGFAPGTIEAVMEDMGRED